MTDATGRPGPTGREPHDHAPAEPAPSAVVLRGGRAVDALSAAAALALATIISSLVPVLGAARASDGSSLWFAPGALWLGLLPVVVVVVLAARRPVVALAVAAGAGLLGLARFLADLPVLTAPNAIARPDLFVETTDRALPLHAAPGGFLLLAADLITLAAGVFAAIRLSGRLSFQRADPPRSGPGTPGVATPIAGTPSGGSEGVDTPSTDSGTADSEGVESGGVDHPSAGTSEFPSPFAAYDVPDYGRSVPRRNYLLTTVGFVAALLIALGAMGVPYQGGYLSARYVQAGVPLAGMIGVVVLAVLAGTAVLVAGILPRPLAVGLLAGVALGACLPSLVALAAAVTAPVQLAGSVWLGLAGGVVLVVAGLLARVGWERADEDRVASRPSRTVSVLAGAMALVAAALAAAASLLPPLDAGGLEQLLVLHDGSAVPGPVLFAAAAIVLGVGGVLALLPGVAPAGRVALTVLWAAPVAAVTLALDVLDDDNISLARSAGLITVGSSIWCGVAALVAAGVAAVLAAVGIGRTSDAEASVPDDDSVAAARAVTVPVAAVLAALAVAAAVLPVYRTGGELQGPTILHGYTVQSWGVWAALLVTVGAVTAGAVTRRRAVALAVVVAAAAVQAVRLVIPAAIRGAAGFDLQPGAVVEAVLVLALLGGAVVFWTRAARVRTLPIDELDVVPAGGGASSDRTGRAPRRATRSTKAAGRRVPQNRRKRR